MPDGLQRSRLLHQNPQVTRHKKNDNRIIDPVILSKTRCLSAREHFPELAQLYGDAGRRIVEQFALLGSRPRVPGCDRASVIEQRQHPSAH